MSTMGIGYLGDSATISFWDYGCVANKAIRHPRGDSRLEQEEIVPVPHGFISLRGRLTAIRLASCIRQILLSGRGVTMIIPSISMEIKLNEHNGQRI